MANGFHQTTIIGNVVADAATRFTPKGQQVTDFTVAVNEEVGKDKAEVVTYYKVTGWDKVAEVFEKFVVKGMQIMVQGTVSVEAYLDKNNAPRAGLHLRPDKFKFLGGGKSQGAASEGRRGNSTYGGHAQDDADEIPF